MMKARRACVDFDGTAIRAIIATPRCGRLVTLGVPGLEISRDGQVWFSPDGMCEAIRHLAKMQTRLLLFLPEVAECPREVVPVMRGLCKMNGIGFIALPIIDFSVPSSAWERAWMRIAATVRKHLDADETIAVCCLHGAGRSGMIAAMILQDRGLNTQAAIDSVRKEFSESIESPLQETWLHRRSPLGHF